MAAAGPMGPPIAGAALTLSSRSPEAVSMSLKILASFLLISAAVWVRSLFGLCAIPLLGVAVMGVAFKGSKRATQSMVQLLGVQACASTYRQFKYLFSYSAGPPGISDTAKIQQVLLLPYWFRGRIDRRFIAAGSRAKPLERA